LRKRRESGQSIKKRRKGNERIIEGEGGGQKGK
jgi:hypothetical protein